VYSSGEWGLQAYNISNQPLMADGTPVSVDEWGFPTDPDQRPVEFNWEYSSDGSWGAQTFLCTTANCAATTDYKLLSDPVSLSPFNLTNGKGDPKTLSLQFDGWMHGLPDLHQELSKNNWKMTQDIRDKVVNIPAGTSMTDSEGSEYYVKPLEVSVFINEVDVNNIPLDSRPDLTQVSASELSDLPTFVEHNMGALPTNDDGSPLSPKYSEGDPVE
jgi:hypothetical protein